MSIGVASKVWRDGLLREVKLPELSQSFDIKKYYDFAKLVFDQAEQADMENKLAHGYIKYKQYIGLGQDVICKHNYYKHYAADRSAHVKQMAIAVDRLELLVKRMDEECVNHAAKVRQEETARLAAAKEREATARTEALREQLRAAAGAQQAAARLRETSEAQARAAAAAEAEKAAAGREEARANAEAQARVLVRRREEEEGERAAAVAAAAAAAAAASAVAASSAEREACLVVAESGAAAAADKAKASAFATLFGEEGSSAGNSHGGGGAGVGAASLGAGAVGRWGTYTHADGSEEQVRVVRVHSEAEGGGVTVFVPSSGVERQTVPERLCLLEPPSNGDPSNGDHSNGVDLLGLSTDSKKDGDVSNSNEAALGPAPSWTPTGNGGLLDDLMADAGPTGAFTPMAQTTPLLPAKPPTRVEEAAPAPSAPPPEYGDYEGGNASDSSEEDGDGDDDDDDDDAASRPGTGGACNPQSGDYGERPGGETAALGFEGGSLAETLAAAAAAAAASGGGTAAECSSSGAGGAAARPPMVPTSRQAPPLPSQEEASSSSLYALPISSGALYSSRQLKRECLRLWDSLLGSGRARKEFLSTYQGVPKGWGRPDSTNGCTVIAPLIGYRHIKWTADPRLPNSHIEHVIDEDCPPILASIRQRFSLPAGAFVVPADVHDYLFDRKLLEESLFGGVHGGNVLDDEHMGAMLTTLEEFPPQDKAAVCFFFHEHVCAILKTQHGQYELIDSLPHAPVGQGVRILCQDAMVLRACLAWYCTSKFSDRQLDYLDSTPWTDATAELDPRIFQGHVWHAGK